MYRGCAAQHSRWYCVLGRGLLQRRAVKRKAICPAARRGNARRTEARGVLVLEKVVSCRSRDYGRRAKLDLLQHHWSQAMGKCKDHVYVGNGEKFAAACGNPAIAGGSLTLRAVAIAAAVIGNGGTMPAAGTLIEMTAQCGGTTTRNGQQHFDVLPPKPVAVSFEEGSSRVADEICHLQGWPVHYAPRRESSFSFKASSGLGVAWR